MKLDKQAYSALLARKSPPSPLWKDCLKAFLFGGAICTVGEGGEQLLAGPRAGDCGRRRGDLDHHGVPRRAADLPASV